MNNDTATTARDAARAAVLVVAEQAAHAEADVLDALAALLDAEQGDSGAEQTRCEDDYALCRAVADAAQDAHVAVMVALSGLTAWA